MKVTFGGYLPAALVWLGTGCGTSPVKDPGTEAPASSQLTTPYESWDGFEPEGAPEGGARTADAYFGYRIYTLAMHMHGSVSEGGASMAWHSANATTWGTDVIWWTDHDSLYYPNHFIDQQGLDFETGSTYVTADGWPSGTLIDGWLSNSPGNSASGSYYLIADAARTGNFGARLGATADTSGAEQYYGRTLVLTPRLNFKSLLGDVSFRFSYRPVTTSDDAELWIVVPLSATTVGGDADPFSIDLNYRIVFYDSPAGRVYSSLSDGSTIYVPLDSVVDTSASADTGIAADWVTASANITDIATAYLGEAGRDLHAEFVTMGIVAWDGATATYDLDDFEWTMATVGEDLLAAQEAYVDTFASGPVHHFGREVSPLDEGHINVYGSEVGFLPFWDHATWDAASAIDWVHTKKGLVSYNHMFGVGVRTNSEADRAADVADRSATLTADRVYHADLLEVGYRTRGGITSDFLQVWDALSMAGIVITGYGTTDCHEPHQPTEDANNFVTWVPATNAGEASLKNQLRRGRAWFGDPTYFADGEAVLALEAKDLNAQMGNVVGNRTDPVEMTFTADWLKTGWVVRTVENGAVTNTWTVAADGRYTATWTVDPVGGNVVRVEILDATDDDREVAFTNPIYFMDRPGGTIPRWRYPSH